MKNPLITILVLTIALFVVRYASYDIVATIAHAASTMMAK